MDTCEIGDCDGCGARVSLDELSLATLIEGEGFVCEECKRGTIVVVAKRS